MKLTKKQINYIISDVRAGRRVTRSFKKVYGLSAEMQQEYDFQLEIIKVLQSLKEML